MLYSVSQDKHLIMTELTRVDNHYIVEKVFLNELTGIILDNFNSRIFISDSQGSIYLY